MRIAQPVRNAVLSLLKIINAYSGIAMQMGYFMYNARQGMCPLNLNFWEIRK